VSRTEVLRTLLEFFQDQGRILKRSEYMKLGANAPIHWRQLRKHFSNRGYHTTLKILERKFPAEYRQLVNGDIPAKKEEPLAQEPVQEREDELSPLEKLRQRSDG